MIVVPKLRPEPAPTEAKSAQQPAEAETVTIFASCSFLEPGAEALVGTWWYKREHRIP